MQTVDELIKFQFRIVYWKHISNLDYNLGGEQYLIKIYTWTMDL